MRKTTLIVLCLALLVNLVNLTTSALARPMADLNTDLVGRWQLTQNLDNTAPLTGIDTEAVLTGTPETFTYITETPPTSHENTYGGNFSAYANSLTLSAGGDNSIAHAITSTMEMAVSFWIKADGIYTDTQTALFSLHRGNATKTRILTLYSGLSYDNELTLSVGATNYQSNAIVTDGQWHHVGFSLDNDPGDLTGELYVDGVLVNSWTYGTEVNLEKTSWYVLGARYTGSSTRTDHYLGSFDEVRIYKRTLSAEEWSDLANYTVSGDLLAHYQSTYGTGLTLIDDVGRSHGSLYNMTEAAWSVDVPRNMTGYSLVFDGVDDYVKLTNLGALTAGVVTETLTTAFWFKTESIPPSGRYTLFSWDDTRTHGFQFDIDSDGHLLLLDDVIVAPYPIHAETTVSVADGEWHHAAYTNDGTNETLYLDGDVVDSVPHDVMLWEADATVYIGARNEGTQEFPGMIGPDVRIYSRALTQEEIQELAGGGCQFTPGVEVLDGWIAANDIDGMSIDLTAGEWYAIQTYNGPWYDDGVTPSNSIAIGYRYQAPDTFYYYDFRDVESPPVNYQSCNGATMVYFNAPADEFRIRVNDGTSPMLDSMPRQADPDITANTGSIRFRILSASPANSCDSVYTIGDLVDNQLIPATSENGYLFDLTPGSKYMLETYGGPWLERVILPDDRYDLAASSDNLQWYDLSSFWWFDCEGSAADPYQRFYFTALGDLAIRVNDLAGWFGDNSGSMGVRVYEVSGESCEANFLTGDVVFAGAVDIDSSGGTSIPLDPQSTYMIETSGGPWHPAPAGPDRFDSALQMGATGWQQFYTPDPGWMLCQVATGDNGEYRRGYFTASTSSLDIRANDATNWTDNTGSLYVTVKSATRTTGGGPVGLLSDGNMEVYPPALSPWTPYAESEFIRLYQGFNSIEHGQAYCGVAFQMIYGEETAIGGDDPSLGVYQNFEWPGGTFYWRAAVAANRGIWWFLGPSYVDVWVQSSGGGTRYQLMTNRQVASDWQDLTGNLYLPPGIYSLYFTPGSQAGANDKIYLDDVAVDQITPTSACQVTEPTPTPMATATGTITPQATNTPTRTPTVTPGVTPVAFPCAFEGYDDWILNPETVVQLSGGPVGPQYLDASGGWPGAQRAFSWPGGVMFYTSFVREHVLVRVVNVSTNFAYTLHTSDHASWTVVQGFSASNLAAGTYRLELNSFSSSEHGHYDGVTISSNGYYTGACIATPTPGATSFVTPTYTPTGPTPTQTNTPLWWPTSTSTPMATSTNTPWPTPTLRFPTNTPTLTPTASPTGQPTLPVIIVTLEFPDVGTPEYQPPPAWDADCLRPENTWQISGWVEYNRCVALSWFSWGPPHSATVEAFGTVVAAREPVGSILEFQEMSSSLATQWATANWGGLGGQIFTPVPPDLSNFMPGENSPWSGAPIDIGPSGEGDGSPYSDACVSYLEPDVGEALAQGICWVLEFVNEIGIMPYLQVALDLAAIMLLLLYVVHKLVDAGTGGT